MYIIMSAVCCSFSVYIISLEINYDYYENVNDKHGKRHYTSITNIKARLVFVSHNVVY